MACIIAGPWCCGEEQPYQFPHNYTVWLKVFPFGMCNTKIVGTCLKPCDHIYRLHITYDIPISERRAKTGVVAGIDQRVSNPTVVRKTVHNASNIASYDTATAFRTNHTWNDETRRTVSHRNKHSNSTHKIKRKREKYNHGNANDRECAEWLLAKKICEGVDVIYVEQLNLEAMTRRGGRHKKGLSRGMRFIRHSAILRKIHMAAERLGSHVVGASLKHTIQENRYGEMFSSVVSVATQQTPTAMRR